MTVYRIDTRRPQPVAQDDAQHDDTEAGALDKAPALLASLIGPVVIVAIAAVSALLLAAA